MEAFPFQSNFLGFDEAGNPKYDRAVGAEFMRDREKLFYTNGIFANPSDNFQVLNGTGMQVKVRPGTCFIEGASCLLHQDGGNGAAAVHCGGIDGADRYCGVAL